jgi:hypothetical protein
MQLSSSQQHQQRGHGASGDRQRVQTAPHYSSSSPDGTQHRHRSLQEDDQKYAKLLAKVERLERNADTHDNNRMRPSGAGETIPGHMLALLSGKIKRLEDVLRLTLQSIDQDVLVNMLNSPVQRQDGERGGHAVDEVEPFEALIDSPEHVTPRKSATTLSKRAGNQYDGDNIANSLLFTDATDGDIRAIRQVTSAGGTSRRKKRASSAAAGRAGTHKLSATTNRPESAVDKAATGGKTKRMAWVKKAVKETQAQSEFLQNELIRIQVEGARRIEELAYIKREQDDRLWEFEQKMAQFTRENTSSAGRLTSSQDDFGLDNDSSFQQQHYRAPGKKAASPQAELKVSQNKIAKFEEILANSNAIRQLTLDVQGVKERGDTYERAVAKCTHQIADLSSRYNRDFEALRNFQANVELTSDTLVSLDARIIDNSGHIRSIEKQMVELRKDTNATRKSQEEDRERYLQDHQTLLSTIGETKSHSESKLKSLADAHAQLHSQFQSQSHSQSQSQSQSHSLQQASPAASFQSPSIDRGHQPMTPDALTPVGGPPPQSRPTPTVTFASDFAVSEKPSVDQLKRMIEECNEQIKVYTKDKARSKNVIRKWLGEFEKEHGRKPTNEDKELARDMYIDHQTVRLILLNEHHIKWCNWCAHLKHSL